MVRTIVIPENNQLSFSIPNNYVGKKIEVMYYAVDEIEAGVEVTPQVMANNAARFKGLLTSEEADKYHAYLKQARSEWDRDI